MAKYMDLLLSGNFSFLLTLLTHEKDQTLT